MPEPGADRGTIHKADRSGAGEGAYGPVGRNHPNTVVASVGYEHAPPGVDRQRLNSPELRLRPDSVLVARLSGSSEDADRPVRSDFLDDVRRPFGHVHVSHRIDRQIAGQGELRRRSRGVGRAVVSDYGERAHYPV